MNFIPFNMYHNLKILKTEKSKIQDVDFNNFSFGSVFTDHMFECDFIDGKWINPTIKPYQAISVEPSASVFHYGQAIFEGMKAYKDKNDEVWLFRPDQNFERINKSAVRMAIPEFPKDLFFKAITKLVDMLLVALNVALHIYLISRIALGIEDSHSLFEVSNDRGLLTGIPHHTAQTRTNNSNDGNINFWQFIHNKLHFSFFNIL